MTIPYPELRNVAIIAHVDHGKTTLVDALLKQSHVFRENQHVGEQILDSNELERERGITILAKNTAITYRGVKINIIDTPGHADFSGEVERVLNMADGCLLVVDAAEGPMPQTRYVLKEAIERNLKAIVVINKIDRKDSRVEEVVKLVQDLFLELATDAEQLDFPIIYAVGREGIAVTDLSQPRKSMEPLFEAILKHIPPTKGDASGPLQMLVAALAYDNHLGQIAIGRIFRGAISPGESVIRIDRNGQLSSYKLTRVFVFQGLERKEVERAPAGEIVAVTGVEEVAIGDTIASSDKPEALPGISIDEPTVKMTFGVNTSTFAGKDGTFCTSRQLRARLYKELQTNVSLRVKDTDSADVFLVSGRGELHLSILIEIMRREGYEMQVSKPEAVTKAVDGKLMEPYEMLLLDTREDYIGPLTENLSKRLALLVNMTNDGKGNVRMEFKVPTRGAIGFRSFFLRATRGNGVLNSVFLGYEPLKGQVRSARTGALVAFETGTAVTFGLNNAQERGNTFIDPGTPVYEGMVVGIQPRDGDLAVNVCKEKKLTNMRASSSDIAVRLTPAIKMSLEEALDFIQADELVEVTPKNIRLRKRILRTDDRQKAHRDRPKVEALA